MFCLQGEITRFRVAYGCAFILTNLRIHFVPKAELMCNTDIKLTKYHKEYAGDFILAGHIDPLMTTFT